MIKSNFLTSVFQKYLSKKDIRELKGNVFYYLFFRIIRSFLSFDLILKIYNFKVYGSLNKNKTSHFLLKKCEFGDYHELDTIKKFSQKKRLLFVDCGCNYGFYSFYTASLSEKNLIISVDASKKTLEEFNKNFNLNTFKNIYLFNKAVSNSIGKDISFNESINDWESSQTHKNFISSSVTNVKSITIDSLLHEHVLNNYLIIIKLDIEGNEINAIKGALRTIEQSEPLIIIEFSKYIFDNQDNINYLKNFLNEYDYAIFDNKNQKKDLSDIINMIRKLKKKYKTIGNFYLIKKTSNNLKLFLSNE